MTKIVLEFGSMTELDDFVSEYIGNAISHAQGMDEEVEASEQYAQDSFENATRWSESKRTHIEIQDMELHHLFNALAQEITTWRQPKQDRPSFILSALIWHAWQRVKEDITENCLDN